MIGTMLISTLFLMLSMLFGNNAFGETMCALYSGFVYSTEAPQGDTNDVCVDVPFLFKLVSVRIYCYAQKRCLIVYKDFGYIRIK